MPSVVGTSSVVTAVSYPFQRKTFHHNGRFWVFYSDGTNLVYCTSADGEDWTDPTTIGSCTAGDRFSVVFDGTYLHYARFHNYYVYYRRGTPNGDGTITWSAAEQTISAPVTSHNQYFPSLIVDSNGYVWLGCRVSVSSLFYPYVLKNANTDGTWSTESEHQLSTTVSSNWRVQVLALTNGKIYAIYCYNANLLRGQLYNGTDWSAEETDLADYNIENASYFSAINNGDDVHLVYNRQTTYQIRYNKRTYGVGWGANDILVQDSMEATSAPALSIDTATSNLYCFWIKISTDHIYYKKCVSETWDTDPTDWIDESTDTILYGYVLTCFPQSYSNYIGLAYVTLTASPFNVKFAFLEISAVILKEVTDSIGLADAILRDKTLSVLDTVTLAELIGISKSSLVGTVTSPYATQASFQRKAFYANGLFWVFYDNYPTGYFVYRTSSDGVTWSDPTNVRAGEYGPHMSIFFDGTYVHYAYTTYGSALYYRRGTPNSDGTITWSAAEQVVDTNSNLASNPHISVDTNGYVWIGYREGNTGVRTPWVIKSGNNDGTWGTTPPGFPYQLSTTQTSYWTAVPVTLTDGKMLIVYAMHEDAAWGYQVRMRAWNGSAWLTEVLTTSGIFHSMHHSETAQGDDVHIAFLKYTVTDMSIIHVKYTYSSNSLGSEVSLQDTITSGLLASPVIAINADNGDLYIFWMYYPSQNHIYYRKWNGSIWEDRIDWLDETADGLNTSADTEVCFYKAYGGYLGLLYMTKTSSPYNVKFGYLVSVAIILKEVADSLSLSDAVLRDKILTVSDSLGLADVISTLKTLLITDTITLSDAIEVITGAIIKYVTDTLGLSDEVKIDKTFIISDTLSLLDQIFRHKPQVSVADAVALAEVIAVSKLFIVTDQLSLSDMVSVFKQLQISDSVSLADQVSTPTRILQALDAVGLSDTSYVNKTLIITDQIALAEVVEVGKGGAKTKLFLILGNIAIQLT
jgi:hypothetical protein